MGEIVSISKLDDRQLNQAVDVFVEGFYDTLKNFSKDKEILRSLFVNSFDADLTYVYIDNGEAVGFIGLADHKKRPTKLSRDTFMKVFGDSKGKYIYKSASMSFEKVKVNSPDELCIDYIATHPAHRSKGIGRKLVEYVRDNMGYKYIWLEVSSKNTRGIAFYEREGFKKTDVKVGFLMALSALLSGFGKLITMRMEVVKRP